MTCKQPRCCKVSRMLCINIDISHCRHDSRQYHVPRFIGVFVDSHFDALKHRYLLGKLIEGSLETESDLFALFGCSGEPESYDMFYHI